MVDLKRLMFDMSLSQRELAQIIGTAQSEISHFANGRRDLKGQYLQSLIDYFGEDVIDSYILPTEPFKPTTHTAEVTILNPETIADIKKELRQELRGDTMTTCPHGEDCSKPIPFIGRDIATAPNINVRELIETKRNTLEQFPMWKMLRNVDYIQTVITMAMAPRYLPGDYLFISFRNNSQILSGKIYLVDTVTYGTMLRYVYIEEGGYTLKASNPEFKPVFVKNEDIYSISSVVLSVNTNTSLTSEVNLAELVKDRDKHIAALTDSQEKLINEVTKQNERMDKILDRLDAERSKRDELVDRLLSKDNQ